MVPSGCSPNSCTRRPHLFCHLPLASELSGRTMQNRVTRSCFWFASSSSPMGVGALISGPCAFLRVHPCGGPSPPSPHPRRAGGTGRRPEGAGGGGRGPRTRGLAHREFRKGSITKTEGPFGNYTPPVFSCTLPPSVVGKAPAGSALAALREEHAKARAFVEEYGRFVDGWAEQPPGAVERQVAECVRRSPSLGRKEGRQGATAGTVPRGLGLHWVQTL